MPGPNGQRGDLHLTVRVAPHERFSVLNDDDLLVEVKVSAWDAALGARLRVPTLDGSVALTLPPGQSSGQRLRLRGKGLPKRDGEKGDLYAEIRITVPKTLTDEQRELFEKLRGIEHQKTSQPHAWRPIERSRVNRLRSMTRRRQTEFRHFRCTFRGFGRSSRANELVSCLAIAGASACCRLQNRLNLASAVSSPLSKGSAGTGTAARRTR